MRKNLSSLFAVLMMLGVARVVSADQKVVQPHAAAKGTWQVIGQTHANHTADHDGIVVKGPFDNFSKLKFKVTDAPLNMQHMVVTYENGEVQQIEVRQQIPKGGESRVIDLKGIGQRRIRRIDFWYDTKGFLNGKADVTVFGRK
ncbi:MAG: hypothetical protein ACRD1B_07245 [Thermoanaerobaculia bacterium]